MQSADSVPLSLSLFLTFHRQQSQRATQSKYNWKKIEKRQKEINKDKTSHKMHKMNRQTTQVNRSYHMQLKSWMDEFLVTCLHQKA